MAVLTALALAPTPAWARSSSLLPYPIAEVWPTAIRFLRIDRGATVREKDLDSGYVLFDLPENGKTWKGALELVRTTDGEQRESTRVVVTLNDLPRHYEGVLLDKLAIKVKDEYGSPAPAPPRRPAGEGSKPAEDERPPPPKKAPPGDLPRAPTVELPRPG